MIPFVSLKVTSQITVPSYPCYFFKNEDKSLTLVVDLCD